MAGSIVGSNIPFKQRNMRGVFHTKIKEDRASTRPYQGKWVELFNGMYGAWGHAPAPSRFEALFNTATGAIGGLGLFGMAIYLMGRFDINRQARCNNAYCISV